MRDFEQNRATELCEQIQVINRRTLVHWATFVGTHSNRKSVMHPLKKDEFALINKMKFETKNVLEHLNRVADQSKKINREEMERRLTELSRYSKNLRYFSVKLTLKSNARFKIWNFHELFSIFDCCYNN